MPKSEKIQHATLAGCYKDTILENAEYFRISRAAKILKCKANDLLHLGAVGKAEIMAAIVQAGEFEWPNGIAGVAFPMLDSPFCIWFDAKDRVVLNMDDLALIEAVGWANPTKFWAPKKARELVASWERSESALSGDEASDLLLKKNKKQLREYWLNRLHELESGDSGGVVTTMTRFQSPKPSSTEEIYEAESIRNMLRMLTEPSALSEPELAMLKEMAYNSAWHAIEPPSTNKGAGISIEHLFISKKELDRLQAGHPQDDITVQRQIQESLVEKKRPHQNSENNARKREEVLKAAICCKETWPDDCVGQRDWAHCIEEHALTFWPEQGEPPLATDTIERLLGHALKLSDKTS